MGKTSFVVPLLVGLASVTGFAAPAAAQYFDPYYDDAYEGGTESFVDEYGRIVTVDAYGRVVAVEEPPSFEPRERRRRDYDDRAIILEGPPPSGSGLTLEGRVGEVPPGVDGGFSADPFARERQDEAYYEAPLEPLPRPDDTYTGSVGRGGGAPGDYPAGDLAPEGSTVGESDPAPRIAGPTGPNVKVQVAALQVLLDRAGASPGVIDGKMGSNVDKAVASYREMTGRTIDATDSQALAEELDMTGGPAVISYTVTNEDVAGPYVAAIPDDYAEKALLPAMSYSRISEMLAERFHMDESYLVEINPGADFNRPGTVLKVMAVGAPVQAAVARIVADKGREQVRAYDAAGTLVAAYPSTIGSSDTPSPSGTVEVSRIALDPNYTYNPKINFKQGENDKILTIPPGPNGPVGSVWIALSKPTYGIHGTPEPSKIGKTNSHGCVRLTNFDAGELAKIVKPGVTVEFLE